ncbi:PulJ/GspJ family protein [Sutcliffiella horikoshii]|uniref:Prepilin-type N-terminal cleavage/methylation domain-containing protein n=1 Tax=Sutcliffiella horikoshii TaxID=79883 RepID=A0A5D4TAD1_9BACI|nr:prepilin-type N-terminal cleavage/methylation domain-containing protein [Sutcliffiella horikoshii]TYS71226.1 prepilin-type N-terminal cleavage/methylation domain-containing protein [Sutcliffiella horikoshii]
MKRKRLLNQSGVTLLEVLVSLAILAFVGTLTFSVLATTIKHEETTSSHITLRQESNIIISSIRENHQTTSLNYNLCPKDLLANNDLKFKDFSINQTFIDKNDCIEINPSEKTDVTFTLIDKLNKTFNVSTTLEPNHVHSSIVIKKDPPVLEEPPPTVYESFLYENIFIFGSDFGIYGSTPVNGVPKEKLGTILINNYNKKDLKFTGNTPVVVHRILIDKKGNAVTFDSSTKLGRIGTTETIHINGDVNLNNGGSEINADTVIINGNVLFGSSGKITAKKVFISGNVNFGNWSALLQADEVYIAGRITERHSGNVVGSKKAYNPLDVPTNEDLFENMMPVLKEDSWYGNNGYTSGGTLKENSKIFANSYTSTSYNHNNLNNVVVVSKGDITITGLGAKGLKGILIAPYGKVTFGGASFEGIVIARDGFYTQTNPSITFNNIESFFPNENALPFK